MSTDSIYMVRALILCLLARTALLCSPVSNISIIQHNLAERPNGVVELTCIIHGVDPRDIEYYWWLMQERNSPVFTYSRKYGINEIDRQFIGIVQNETHAFKDDMSSSTLVLKTNLTGRRNIRCEYNMADDTTCKVTKRIKFAGPRIQIESFGKPIPYGSENVTRFFIAVSCHFDWAAGNPRIAITIDGHSGEIVAERSVIQQSADNFHGQHFAAMLLASDVTIICSVTDDTGTHNLSRLVTLNENKTHDSSQDRLLALALVIAVIVTAITVSPIFLVLIRRLSNQNNIQTQQETLSNELPLSPPTTNDCYVMLQIDV